MLKTRVISGVVAGLIVLGTILLGPLPWHILVWIGTLIGTWEYCQIIGLPRLDALTVWAALAVTAVVWWFPAHLSVIVPVLTGVAVAWPVLSRNRVQIAQSSSVAIGVLYIGYGGGSLAAVRAFPHGFAWVFYLLVSVWMTDTAAYFVGKRIGGPKLWPSISPSKTLSGALGGIVGAAVGALIWGSLMLRGTDIVVYPIVGALLSVASQLGDLVESAYKRSAGVKDSGSIMPGHGGLLDRVDGLFIAAPVLYFLVVLGSSTWFR